MSRGLDQEVGIGCALSVGTQAKHQVDGHEPIAL